MRPGGHQMEPQHLIQQQQQQRSNLSQLRASQLWLGQLPLMVPLLLLLPPLPPRAPLHMSRQ